MKSPYCNFTRPLTPSRQGRGNKSFAIGSFILVLSVSFILTIFPGFSSNGYAQSATSEKPFSFLFIADTATTQNYYIEALQFAHENYPNLKMIFYNYDFSNPSEPTYKNMQSEWQRNPRADSPAVPVFFVMGNHDIENPAAVDYQVKTLGPLLASSLPGMQNFKEGPYDIYPQHDNYEDRYLQYSFEYGNSLFIVLNNYYHDIVLGLDRFQKGYAPKGCMNDDQLAWLEGLLKNTTAEHKFLFMHEPAYPSPGTKHAGDSMDNVNCPGNSNDNPESNPVRPMRERFWALLAKYRATAAFSGHNHNDAQTWIGYPYDVPGRKLKTPAAVPVYDIAGGELGATRKMVIVQVAQAAVTISQYEASPNIPGTSGYKKKLDDIIIDRSPTQPNHPPKILQFQGGESYQPTDRSSVKFEAGTSLSGDGALYFEARDNNIQDTIKFVIDKAPSFLVAKNEGKQFRRISFTTKPKYILGATDVGNHILALRVTDGHAEDTKTLTISVLPAEKPNPKQIFVDKTHAKDCPDNYNPTARACSSPSTGLSSYDSIQKAGDTAQAGDTVLIRAGAYKETIRPANSGTAGRPIIYKNYEKEEVIINGGQLRNIPSGENTDVELDRYGIYLWDKSHIEIAGLNFDNLASGWARIVKSHHIILKTNTFTRALARGTRASIKFLDSHDNKILNNVIEDGNDNLILLKSDRNIVEGNTFRKGRHVLWAIKCGNFNVVRNNYFHNEIQKIGEIYDCNDPNSGDFKHFGIKLTDSAKHNLVENNVLAFTKDTPGLAKFNGIQYAGQHGIIRNNVFYDNLGGGLGMTVYDKEAEHNHGNRIYNNVFYNNHHGGIIYTYYSGGGAPCWSDNIHKNNIFCNNFDMAQVHINTWKPACFGGFSFDNNLLKDTLGKDTIYYTGASPQTLKEKGPIAYWQKKYPRFFTNNYELEPEFADAQNHDFHLKQNSQMIDKATFLTQTIAPGSGISLQVEDASYFYDGYGIETEKGDLIQLQGQTQTARVIAIDYIKNILTLDRSLTWDSKKGVSLCFSGQSPDLGAYEFR